MKGDFEARIRKKPERYPRQIDAALLDDEIRIICKQSLYEAHFGPALKGAFPLGNDEARNILSRLIEPRKSPFSSKCDFRSRCRADCLLLERRNRILKGLLRGD